jgi:hypothetical protein
LPKEAPKPGKFRLADEANKKSEAAAEAPADAAPAAEATEAKEGA